MNDHDFATNLLCAVSLLTVARITNSGHGEVIPLADYRELSMFVCSSDYEAYPPVQFEQWTEAIEFVTCDGFRNGPVSVSQSSQINPDGAQATLGSARWCWEDSVCFSCDSGHSYFGWVFELTEPTSIILSASVSGQVLGAGLGGLGSSHILWLLHSSTQQVLIDGETGEFEFRVALDAGTAGLGFRIRPSTPNGQFVLGSQSATGTLNVSFDGVVCCLPDGTCQEIGPSDCEGMGGESFAGSSCDEAECGACCLEGDCQVVPKKKCEDELSGLFRGMSSSCEGRGICPEICFYVDEPSLLALSPGHAFVGLTGTEGQTAFIGKYGNENYVLGLTNLKNDGLRCWSRKICYQVSAEQFNTAVAKINADIASGSDYKLFFANCVDWTHEVALAAGLSLPPIDGLFNVSGPLALSESLDAIGNGNSFMDGQVEFNSNSTQSANGGVPCNPPDAPRDWDASQLFMTADDPATIALNLELPLLSQDPVFVMVPTASSSVTINIEGAVPEDAGILVTWGDNTQDEAQQESFVHNYSSEDLYFGSVTIIDASGVYRTDFTVQVGPGPLPLGDAVIAVEIPDLPPVVIDNDGFEPALPLLPIPLCGGDSNGDGIVNVNDLNNVILDWGTDGSANGGDLTDPSGTGPPDGIVNVNDLNAVIVNWGACP